MLTPDTKAPAELLIERTPPVIPKSNKYVFARAINGSLGHLLAVPSMHLQSSFHCHLTFAAVIPSAESF